METNVVIHVLECALNIGKKHETRCVHVWEIVLHKMRGARIFLHKMQGARIFLQSDLKNHWLLNNHPDPLEYFWEPLEFILGKTVCHSFFFCVSFILFDDWMTAFFVCLDLKNEQRNRSFASKWGILDVIVKTQAFYAFYLYRLLDTSHCIPWKWRKTNHFDTFFSTIRRCFLIDTSLYICFIKHCHDDTFALPLDLGIRECTRLATWEPHSLERDFMMSS